MSRASLAARVAGRSQAESKVAATPIAAKPANQVAVQPPVTRGPSVVDLNSQTAQDAILQALAQRGFHWA